MAKGLVLFQVYFRATQFFKTENNLLDIEEGEGDGLPEVVTVLAGDLEVLVPLLLDQRAVLDRHRVPHEVFL